MQTTASKPASGTAAPSAPSRAGAQGGPSTSAPAQTSPDWRFSRRRAGEGYSEPSRRSPAHGSVGTEAGLAGACEGTSTRLDVGVWPMKSPTRGSFGSEGGLAGASAGTQRASRPSAARLSRRYRQRQVTPLAATYTHPTKKTIKLDAAAGAQIGTSVQLQYRNETSVVWPLCWANSPIPAKTSKSMKTLRIRTPQSPPPGNDRVEKVSRLPPRNAISFACMFHGQEEVEKLAMRCRGSLPGPASRLLIELEAQGLEDVEGPLVRHRVPGRAALRRSEAHVPAARSWARQVPRKGGRGVAQVESVPSR